jgi:protein-disulfide isomerase
MEKKESSTSGKRSSSRKLEMRERRRKQAQRNKWIIIGSILLVVAAVAGVLIWTQWKQANAPIGDIIIPTGLNRPAVNGNSVGDPDAPVKLTEVADFQCPACKSFSENIEQTLLDNFVATGKVYFTYETFSFLDEQSSGRESKAAAEAAYCAMDQNRYWDFHDILYANQTGENIGDFTNRRLTAFAAALGLDMEAFSDCFESGKYKQRVLDELVAAPGRGINSTPSFLINGQLIKIESSWQELFDALDAAYAAAEN